MECKTINACIDVFALSKNNPARYPFLLASNGPASSFARYHILMGFSGEPTDALENIDQYFAQKPPQFNSLPPVPFSLGWFICLTYEAFSLFEPTVPAYCSGLPKIFIQDISGSVVVDRMTAKTYLFAKNARIMQSIESDLKDIKKTAIKNKFTLNFQTESAQTFISKVERVQWHLQQGNSFQVNIARKWSAKLPEHILPSAIYQQLQQYNPSPFAAMANINGHCVLSCSPEQLVHVDKNRRILTKPIAGTMAVLGPHNQKAQLNQFLNDPKERAEHTMIVDLLRNDMNRICQNEAVVERFMDIETYPHLHHIVSTITGQLQYFQPSKIIKSLFPGGSITGCPKISTAQIIHEIEKIPRGFYTGSLGYIDQTGSMNLNILIRTLVASGDQISFHTGSGIVIDSVARHEEQETKNKAKPIIDALNAYA